MRNGIPLSASHHVLKSSPAVTMEIDPKFFSSCEEEEGDSVSSNLICKTLYAWGEPVSPHLAARREGFIVKDSEVLATLRRCFRDVHISGLGKERSEVMCCGVTSPSPSGSLQCDMYRPLHIPSILVGDGRVGCISGTISAYENLMLRGYDVVAVVFEDRGLLHDDPQMSYLRNRVPVLVLPTVPKRTRNISLNGMV